MHELNPAETSLAHSARSRTVSPTAKTSLTEEESTGRDGSTQSVVTVPRTTLVTLRCRHHRTVTRVHLRLFTTLDRLKAVAFSVGQSPADGSLSFFTQADRAEEVVRELRREFSAELQSGALGAIDSWPESSTSEPSQGDMALPAGAEPVSAARALAEVVPRAAAACDFATELPVTHGKAATHRAAGAVSHTRIVQRRRVHLAIAGPTGLVGRSLLRLLGEPGSWLRSDLGLELGIVGAINTRTMTWEENGIHARRLIDRLAGEDGAQWETFSGLLHSHRGEPLVFLDCTASAFIARQYASLLKSNIAIVTPNKIANSVEFAYYDELQRLMRQKGARYRYETTVGAATPMLQTLRTLRRTGDTISRMEGVLSGTLSYAFKRVNRGKSFSRAVAEAAQRGFTEPHPATDLSGEDVARKLLILAREAGYSLEPEQIQVESLVPSELRDIADPHEFIRRLATFDGTWADRTAQAHTRGRYLAYVARFDGSNATVGVAEVPQESVFVRLQASENAVRYYTDRHTPLPLTIQGIGAGPEVTARGVLADVIDTALRLTSS